MFDPENETPNDTARRLLAAGTTPDDVAAAARRELGSAGPVWWAMCDHFETEAEFVAWIDAQPDAKRNLSARAVRTASRREAA